MVATGDVNETRAFAPKMPEALEAETVELAFDYDRRSDTLVVRFAEADRPTVGLPFRDYLALRVDPATQEIVGVEVERFLAAALYQNLELSSVLPHIGLTRIERLRVLWNMRHFKTEGGRTIQGALVATLAGEFGRRVGPVGTGDAAVVAHA